MGGVREWQRDQRPSVRTVRSLNLINDLPFVMALTAGSKGCWTSASRCLRRLGSEEDPTASSLLDPCDLVLLDSRLSVRRSLLSLPLDLPEDGRR